jgi:hypothetical protein
MGQQPRGQVQYYTATPPMGRGGMQRAPMSDEMVERLTERLEHLEKALRTLEQHLAKHRGDVNMMVDAEEPEIAVDVAEFPDIAVDVTEVPDIAVDVVEVPEVSVDVTESAPDIAQTDDEAVLETDQEAGASEESDCCPHSGGGDCCSPSNDDEGESDADEPDTEIGVSNGLSIYM